MKIKTCVCGEKPAIHSGGQFKGPYYASIYCTNPSCTAIPGLINAHSIISEKQARRKAVLKWNMYAANAKWRNRK